MRNRFAAVVRSFQSNRKSRLAVFTIVGFCIWSSLDLSAEAQQITFEQDIRPIFRAHCFDCHGATDELEGALDLRQVRLMLKGGESGEALVKGDATSSLLVERIAAGEMPPGDHRVPAAELKTIRDWIDAGAKTKRPEPAIIPRGLGITPEERAYWAFQPIQRPRVPEVAAVEKVRTPIDAFLLAKLESKDLSFAEDAKREKLIRRAYLDMVGIPPTPTQTSKFLSDQSPEAWNKVVEDLLSSKHYGERWGRHWLDVAGYADSEGADNRDDIRPWAYKYRDWVIKSFNKDMPFDQFITWQLAGDELVSPPLKNFSQTQIEQLTATGFLRMAMDGTARGNNEENRNAVVRDTIDIVSSSLLGMTVKCAQCHDHRYDPISHEDYYRLRAIFEPALDYKNWRVPNARLISLYTDEDHAKAAVIENRAQAKTKEKNEKLVRYMKEALEGVLAGVDEKLREPLRSAFMTPANKRSTEQKALLKKYPSVGSFSPGVLYQYNKKHADELKSIDAEIAKIRAEKPVHEYLRSIAEAKSKSVPKTRLFHRGDYRQPKFEVKPGALTVCASEESPFAIAENDAGLATTGRRLAYARWLTSGRHPLVARVLVNRFWLHHFGRTFVSTPEEFGNLGTEPTHPKLLDWLADEFMAKGWSLKHLHRLILKSTVYRQSSLRTMKGNRLDQDNELYWHFPVHRLEAEVIRDSMLAMGSKLDLDSQFGKPAPFKEDDTGQVIVTGAMQKRSIYLQVRRSKPVSILESFDAPVMKVNCTSRSESTAATQSLMLMNSDFSLKAAAAFSSRINREANAVRQKFDRVPDIDDIAKQFMPSDPWSYGHGLIQGSESNARVKFNVYPLFVDGSWKGGTKLPDLKLGWSLVHARGGHPDVGRASIRRWTSPISGKIKVTGELVHGSPKGNGVELSIISSRQGKLGGQQAFDTSKDYSFEFEVARGEIVDTVVDSKGDPGYDGYTNKFRIEYAGGGKVQVWDSQKDFRGSEPGRTLFSPISKQVILAWQLAYGREPTDAEFLMATQFLKQQFKLLKSRNEKLPVISAMTNLCHMLLSSNEFLYVD